MYKLFIYKYYIYNPVQTHTHADIQNEIPHISFWGGNTQNVVKNIIKVRERSTIIIMKTHQI